MRQTLSIGALCRSSHVTPSLRSPLAGTTHRHISARIYKLRAASTALTNRLKGAPCVADACHLLGCSATGGMKDLEPHEEFYCNVRALSPTAVQHSHNSSRLLHRRWCTTASANTTGHRTRPWVRTVPPRAFVHHSDSLNGWQSASHVCCAHQRAVVSCKGRRSALLLALALTSAHAFTLCVPFKLTARMIGVYIAAGTLAFVALVICGVLSVEALL